MEKDFFEILKEDYISKYGMGVPRTKVDVASAFTVTPKHLANLDSLGVGVPNRQTICGKVVYPASDFFNWLRERSVKQEGINGH